LYLQNVSIAEQDEGRLNRLHPTLESTGATAPGFMEK
jgi:hypothetical protein